MAFGTPHLLAIDAVAIGYRRPRDYSIHDEPAEVSGQRHQYSSALPWSQRIPSVIVDQFAARGYYRAADEAPFEARRAGLR
jgi:hypothetical protein